MKPHTLVPLRLNSAADSAKALRIITKRLPWCVYRWNEGAKVLLGRFSDLEHAERFREQVDGFIGDAPEAE